MKRAGHLSNRAKAVSLVCFIFPLATSPIFYAKEFETIASWYGPGFQGRRTADGERYDQERMTAASKTLPFGTHVLVVNPKNGRECSVVINDRGPYVPGRGIDLSHAAARKLGIGGIAPVICYVGGSSYSDTARKHKRHERMNVAPETEPAVPSPPETAETAQASPENPSTEAHSKVVPDRTQTTVANIPPSGADSVSSANIDRRPTVNVSEPQAQSIVGRSDKLNIPPAGDRVALQSQQLAKAEQAPNTSINTVSAPVPVPQVNEQIAPAPTNSDRLAANIVHPVTVRVQPKPVEALASTQAKLTTNDLPGGMNVPLKLPGNRKPGALLAAAERTPYIYQPPAPQVSAPVYTYVQSPGRYSVPIYGRTIALPNAQASAPVRVEPDRAHNRVNSRYYVTALRTRHYHRRHSYRAESPDLIDRVAFKVEHVCKSVLARL
jgi:rare lipoprotein A (peptidoglycan hydrolase)